MASATPVTDHDEIREWVESRGGQPACVKGTAALLRVDFGKPDEKLQPIEWDQWFETFDSRNLAALIQENGRSRFIKLVDRGNASRRASGGHTAGARGTRAASRGRGGAKSVAGASRKRSTSGTRSKSKSTGGRTQGGRATRSAGAKRAGASASRRTSSGRASGRAPSAARGARSEAGDRGRAGATGRKRAAKKR